MASVRHNSYVLDECDIAVIEIERNQFTGTIPGEGLASLSDLRVLNLQRQGLPGLTGTIPAPLGSLTNIQELRLHENQLEGALPVELASLSNLVELNVRANNLEGTVPTQYGELKSLTFFRLDNNNITGSMPAEICANQLETLIVDCSVECTCCSLCIDDSGTTAPSAAP